MAKLKIALLGAGGNTIDIFEQLKEFTEYETLGYFNKSEDHLIKNFTDLNYLGTESDLDIGSLDGLVITFAGIGRTIALRKAAFEKYKQIALSLFFKESLISKYSQISKKGVIIFGSTVVKSFTNIEDNVFINSGAIIGHHVNIKRNCVISLGVIIGGKSTIEEEVFIGMGARIFQGVKIGKCSIIGSGVIVRKDLPPNSKVL